MNRIVYLSAFVLLVAAFINQKGNAFTSHTHDIEEGLPPIQQQVIYPAYTTSKKFKSSVIPITPLLSSATN